MSDEVAVEVAVGSVVWCRVDNHYPKWPCKVIELTEKDVSVVSFGDDLNYRKLLRTVTLLTKQNLSEMVRAGQKSLRNRKEDLKLFLDAVRTAVDFIKSSNGEEMFTEEEMAVLLDPNSSVCNSSANTSSSSFITSVNNVSFSLRSDILTQGSPISSKRRKERFQRSAASSAPKRYCMGSRNRTSYSSCDSVEEQRDVLLDNTTEYDTAASFYLDAEGTFNSTTASSPPHLSPPPPPAPPPPPPPPPPSPPPHPPYSCPPTVGFQRIMETHKSSPLPSHTPNLLVTSTPIQPNTSTAASTPSSIVTHSPSFGGEDDPPLPVSDSDDELPVFNLSAREINTQNIQPNDILWIKQGRFPFWPSLVTSVRRVKSRCKKIYVFFLGWHDRHPCKITPVFSSSRRNVATYGTADRDTYIKAGKCSDLKDAFDLALQEADLLLHLRHTKDIEGPPIEQMMELFKRRPKYEKPTCSSEHFSSPSKISAAPTTSNDTHGPVVSAFGFDLSREQQALFHPEDGEENGSGSDERETDDDDNEGSQYSFKVILECFEFCKTELTGICRNEVESDLHDAYFFGNIKQQNQVRLLQKFGPAANLSDSKKSKLLDQLVAVTAQVTGGPGNFPYAYDVLLPEAVVRTISNVENCSLQEAWNKFSSYQ